MGIGQLDWIAGFIWSIAADVLPDVYVRGKYRDVTLPATVLRGLAGQIESGICLLNGAACSTDGMIAVAVAEEM